MNSRSVMSLMARALSNISSSTSESPVKKSFESQSPWSAKAQKMIERDDLLSTVTCSQHATQGWMMTKLGVLKSGKLTSRWMIERGNPL